MLNTKLYTLIAVAETLNLTQAAEKLGFTQPAISQHIKALENELGVKLVVRRDTGIKLTNAGEITVKYALKLLEVYNKLKSDIKQPDIEKIKLTLGVDGKSLSLPLSVALLGLVNDDTEFEIKLIFDEIKKLYNLLASDDVDMIITDLLPIDNYEFKAVYNDYLYLYTTADGVKDFNLLSSPLILRPSSCKATELFLEALKSTDIDSGSLKIVATVNDLKTVENLIKAGNGASVMLESETSDKDFIAIPVLEKNISYPLYAVYKKEFSHKDFTSKLTEHFKR